MRFFVVACLFALLVASVGCMTNNWSKPLFDKPIVESEKVDKPDFWRTPFGSKSGIDPRAREIEERLGL